DRYGQLAGQVGQFLGGIAKHDTAADIDHRLAGFEQHADRLFNLPRVPNQVGLVTADLHGIGIAEFGLGDLHVLGKVDQHRAGPAAPGDIEGLLHNDGEVLDVPDQEVVLGAGAGDADDVRLLKGIISYQRRGDLTGDDHERDGVHVGRGDTGDGVGGAGTGGGDGHPDTAGN